MNPGTRDEEREDLNFKGFSMNLITFDICVVAFDLRVPRSAFRVPGFQL